MARNRPVIDVTNATEWYRKGHGQGAGSTWKPWVQVQHVPSLGLSSRVKGWKSSRLHHCLSELELDFFLCSEWVLRVRDILEQVPLWPYEDTLAIAEHAGLRHPQHPKTRKPIVMTSDFRIEVELPDGRRVWCVRALKRSSDLAKADTLVKLELERRFWLARGEDWGVCTELDLSPILVANMHLIHESWYFASYTTLTAGELRSIAGLLTDCLVGEPRTPLRQLAIECDRRLGLAPGTNLQIAYYLLATRQWRFDMVGTRIDPDRPLAVPGVSLGQPR